MKKRLLALALLVLGIGGCASQEASQYARDGVQYGVTEGVFRGRWWSYYERGSSFLAGKFYDEAVADFQEALTGRSRDTWRARTYGLHFVEYFPNRELGIAYFELGNLDGAEQYLKASLDQVDTVRARHYLDRITRERIARGLLQDTDAPVLSAVVVEPSGVYTGPLSRAVRAVAISSEAETLPGDPQVPEMLRRNTGTPVSDRLIEFSIDLGDDLGVSRVAVQGREVPQRGSARQLAVRERILLTEGTHEIEVEATDLADKTTVRKVPVTVDMTGPTLGVFSPIEPTVTPEGSVILEGASVDKNGVSAVSVSEQLIAESPGAPKLPFNSELPLSNGENTFVLAARDVAGNETRSAIKVFRGDPDSVEAKLWLRKQHEEQNALRFASAGGNAAAVQMLLSATSEPVTEIRLKSPVEDRPYRHNRSLRVAGEVLAATTLTSITINGEPVSDLVGAPKESFNKRIPIEQTTGKVRVAVRAEDANGQVLEKEVEVDVQPVTLETDASKMPVAVLAFTGAQVNTETANYLSDVTSQKMLQEGRFNVLDRTNLEQVLQEQQLAGSLADPDTAIQLGRIVNAYALLSGELYSRDAAGLEMKVRVVDTATSKLVSILDAFVENRDDRAALESAGASIAAQLSNLYPRLSGEVLAVRGNQLVLNWGTEDGVKEGAYLLVVQEEPPFVDETTGEILMPGEVVTVSRGRIEAVTETNSRAVTVEQEQEGVALDAGMPAITM